MITKKVNIFIIVILIFALFGFGKSKTISFPSKDNLLITADLYIEHPETAPFIILYHQAGWSRGSYIEIAPKLNKMGFNCMAIDQRSGGIVNDVENETKKRADKKKLGTYYLDAYIDLEAALLYTKEKLAKGKIIVWGSSYSASLVFRLAAENSDKLNGVIAFSPGEYFKKKVGKDNYVSEFASKLKCPVFITSAKRESIQWKGIFDSIKGVKESYLPETAGNHGSRALWEKFEDNKGYWKSVTKFLKQNFLK